MEYIIGILGVLLLLIIIVLSWLLNRATQRIEWLESIIISRRDAYILLLERIRNLDSKEMFEKDDEVGVIFSDIKTEIEEFSKLIDSNE